MKKLLVILCVLTATPVLAQEPPLVEAISVSCMQRQLVLTALKGKDPSPQAIQQLVHSDLRILEQASNCLEKDPTCSKALFTKEQKAALEAKLADYHKAVKKEDYQAAGPLGFAISSEVCTASTKSNAK